MTDFQKPEIEELFYQSVGDTIRVRAKVNNLLNNDKDKRHLNTLFVCDKSGSMHGAPWTRVQESVKRMLTVSKWTQSGSEYMESPRASVPAAKAIHEILGKWPAPGDDVTYAEEKCLKNHQVFKEYTEKQYIQQQNVVDESEMRLAFIVYDDEARFCKGSDVAKVSAGGQTQFREAFSKIKEYIGEHTDPGTSVNIVFMTDGKDTRGFLEQDPDLVSFQTYLRECERKVVLHSLAFGQWTAFDAKLLHDLTQMSNERDNYGKGMGQFVNAKWHSNLGEYFATLLEFADTHLFLDVKLNGVSKKLLGKRIGDKCFIDSLLPKTKADERADGKSACHLAVQGEGDRTIECQVPAKKHDIMFDLKLLAAKDVQTRKELDDAVRTLATITSEVEKQRQPLDKEAKSLLDEIESKFMFFDDLLTRKRELQYFQNANGVGHRFIQMMMKEETDPPMENMVRNYARRWPMQKVADYSVKVINGIADSSEDGFAKMGIRNVRQLAEWRPFLVAKEFCTSVSGKVSTTTVLKNLTGADKQIARHIKRRQDGRRVGDMTVKDLLELPVSAIKGIDDASDRFLRRIGCPITSIRKLAEWKFARWAQRIVEKAAEDGSINKPLRKRLVAKKRPAAGATLAASGPLAKRRKVKHNQAAASC